MRRKTLEISKKEIVLDLIFYITGCAVYSVAVTSLITPNKISPGGFTGIATVVNYLTDFPVGLLLLILNVPIVALGIWRLGGIFIIKTAVATGIMSLSLELADRFVPEFTVNKILAGVFGGILMGAGLSLILRRGATTGGVDIIGTLVNRKLRHITVGKVILISDIIIITFVSIVYKNIESGLYSVVAMYASSRVTDAVLYGYDKGKTVTAITDRPDIICEKIFLRLKRGVTRLPAVGGYTGKEHTMLVCTMRINEVSAVCDIIRENDPHAFIVVSDAGEIIGEGFKNRF